MTCTLGPTLIEENKMSEVLCSQAPVLVYFWAEWCGPCVTMTPILDELADQYQEDISIYRINVDEHPALVTEYGIRAIPTVLIFSRGEVAGQIVGARCKCDIEEMFRQFRR